MSVSRTSLSIDRDVVDRAKPYLRKDGYTVSSFIRKVLWDYVEKKESLKAPITIDSIEELR